MNIKDMFSSNIDRPINGVIKVAQDDEASLKQELSEYIITTELRRHFDTFFDNYSKSIDTPTNNVGVWISGFYGSGKSHFLKILSYLLENKEVAGKKATEYFEDKFEDPMMYSTVKRCTSIPTETILFNIDIEGGAYKDKTAILKVFAKVFYNHLGYYGDDLKIVKLERFIEKKGKTDEFRKVFEEINGDTWINARDSFAFFEDDVVEVLKQVLGMSETAARNWFNGEVTAEISIRELSEDVNEYVLSREKKFRLLFMVDEVGQYINSDVNLKINLQSIVEQLGSLCKGKAWVVVTSQEAIDTFANHTEMDFSGILGRFNTKLSLTSSSADEVIKKRILRKNDTATDLLTISYHQDHAILKNLFTFNECVMDLKGYRDEFDYVATYPFVPYQFTVIQKVFDAIRNYGIASKHQSSGERSLLECYQIAAQKVKGKDQNTLVPFYYFYDTVSNSLDTTIRRVIDRCQRAANNRDGIEQEDVNVLKLLYLLRYIDDIPSNIDNIANLMVDDIRVDKIKLRENVKVSLERLIRSNYVARSGDKYNFLTDEEQDIARDIRNTDVGGPDIRGSIASTIFGEIYQSQKYKYNKYDFPFDKYVDDTINGTSTGGVRLRIVTVAGDLFSASEQKLIMETHTNKEAIVILSEETPYYSELEQAMKIRKYVKSRNISQLSDSVQEIVRKHQSEAKRLENRAKGYIEQAILDGKFYVHGEKVEINGGSAKDKLDNALKNLVESVYSKLSMVTVFADSDENVLKILNEPITGVSTTIAGTGTNNEEALSEVSQWLELQNKQMMPTSMGDIQKRFSEIPYGWREIDIAAIVAKLIVQQKIEVRYGGAIVDKGDRRIVDYLRKKSEVYKTNVIRHVPVDEALIRKVTKFLRDYVGAMAIPTDEVGFIDYVVAAFESKQNHYNDLLKLYDKDKYPQKELVIDARDLMSKILTQKKDNVALLKGILSKQEELLDMKEDIEEVEAFFKGQKQVFDKANNQLEVYVKEQDYFVTEEDLLANLSEVKEILGMAKPYNRIKELPELLLKISTAYDNLLELKKEEVRDIIVQCMGDIHTLAGNNVRLKDEVKKADNHFVGKKEDLNESRSLTVLDAMSMQLLTYKDTVCKRLEVLLTPIQVTVPNGTHTPVNPIKSVSIRRYDLCPARRLQSKEDVDKYIEAMREKLYKTLEDNDSIQIN